MRIKDGFNQGNDCSTCRRRYLSWCGKGMEKQEYRCINADTGRECGYEEADIRECPVCGKEIDRREMSFTRDCHGIAFRLVCNTCWLRLMEKGYDGQYYDESDEQIEDDY